MVGHLLRVSSPLHRCSAGQVCQNQHRVTALLAGAHDIDWDCVNHTKFGHEQVWQASEQSLTEEQRMSLVEQLTDAVVVTTYNSWPYFHQHVDWTRRLSDNFESDSVTEAIPDSGKLGKDNPLASRTHEQAIVENGEMKPLALPHSICDAGCSTQTCKYWYVLTHRHAVKLYRA